MSANRPRKRSYDVLVVGGRCAGAATAMLLARRGLEVLVVDRGQYGSDTLSTHALMRGGVLQLQRWGILAGVRAAGTPTVRTTSFHYGDDVVQVDIKARDGVDGLYAPRRLVIDKLLVDAARAAGAEVVHEVRLTDVVRSADDRVAGAEIKTADGDRLEIAAGLVIGADGMRSTVADLVAAEPYRIGRHATGVVFSYWSGTGLDGYHWYYRPGVSIGAIATNGGHCIFAATPAERFQDELRHDITAGYHRVLEECDPTLAKIVEGAERIEKYRGFPGQPGFFRQSHGPGWALVGDAGYFKDPLTAHGMTDALIDAEALANAVADGTDRALADYQAARDDRALGLFEITDAVASFEWDLAAVRQLHVSLSAEMKRETAALNHSA